jgi:osmotically-inducible protein OsmY
MRPTLSVLIAVTIAAIACDRRSEIADNVQKALVQANMRSVQVEVDDEAQVVHLQGTVETMADRTRANEIATAVVGTTGHVRNDLTVEALSGRDPDDVDGRLTDALDVLLDKDPVLRERDVNITVTDGVAIITGEVRTAAEKNRVERIVKRAAGIKGIDNRLQLRDGR